MFVLDLLSTGTISCRWVLMAYGWMLLSVCRFFSCVRTKSHFSVDIAETDLANITSRLNGSPYLTQEVIYGDGEPITPNQYVSIGDVQE